MDKSSASASNKTGGGKNEKSYSEGCNLFSLSNLLMIVILACLGGVYMQNIAIRSSLNELSSSVPTTSCPSTSELRQHHDRITATVEKVVKSEMKKIEDAIRKKCTPTSSGTSSSSDTSSSSGTSFNDPDAFIEKVGDVVKQEIRDAVKPLDESSSAVRQMMGETRVKLEELMKSGEQLFKKLKGNPMLSSLGLF